MTTSAKIYDLETRMLTFAAKVRDFVSMITQNSANNIYINQLLRSSSSIGANYIEANDAIGKKDFACKLRVSRREAKETRYWLRLILVNSDENKVSERESLLNEVGQLIRILSAILQKFEN